MKLPQLLHSIRSYGRANSAFSWKLLVLERGFLSYRLKLPCDRSAKDAWFGYSPVGALRKLPFILCSRPAEDWLQRSGSSSTISPTTLFMAARGRRDCSRSSTRRGSREYATTPASMPPPLRHLSRKPRIGSPFEFWIPQIYSRTSNRFRRNFAVAARSSDGPFGIPLQTFAVLQCKPSVYCRRATSPTRRAPRKPDSRESASPRSRCRAPWRWSARRRPSSRPAMPHPPARRMRAQKVRPPTAPPLRDAPVFRRSSRNRLLPAEPALSGCYRSVATGKEPTARWPRELSSRRAAQPPKGYTAAEISGDRKQEGESVTAREIEDPARRP
jgi:hypothetical protein